MKAKLPIRKSERFNIFFVPEDHREVRKIRLSIRQIRLLLGGCLLGLMVALFNLVGFCYYRSVYVGSEQERKENLAFAKEREELLSRLKELESIIGSTEKYANNLASLVGTERPELRKGTGSAGSSQTISWDQLNHRVGALQERAKSVDLRIQELTHIQQNKLLYIASTPSIWPVKGWVTSEFGNRRSPFTNARDFHTGIDIASQWGSPIVSPAAGVVRFSGYKGGLGRVVIIDHGYGIQSYHGHASALLVSTGDVVTRGTQIARIGTSGHSTGPHLHYEIHIDGVPVDPMQYILQ